MSPAEERARVTVAGQSSGGRGRSPGGLIGLIAPRDRREAIAEVLAGEGFAVARFDSVQAVIDAEDPGEASPIVLWLQDAVASVGSLIEPLAKRVEHMRLVVVCPSIERWELRAALAAGVAGVVTEDEMRSRLGPCLRAVQVGQVCVPRGYWRQVEPAALSARERQVLGLVVMGCMNSEIAARLFLAESTVKSHLSSAFGKLGVRSRNEAADLITNPEHGLGGAILALDGPSAETAPTTAR